MLCRRPKEINRPRPPGLIAATAAGNPALPEKTRLILTRRPGEAIVINDEIEITLLAVHGSQIRLGSQAPAPASRAAIPRPAVALVGVVQGG